MIKSYDVDIYEHQQILPRDWRGKHPREGLVHCVVKGFPSEAIAFKITISMCYSSIVLRQDDPELWESIAGRITCCFFSQTKSNFHFV